MSDTIIIDLGHGGFDSGAVYQNRKEKDDNLRLALAVGKQLENNGYRVIYTRTVDQYDSPYEKAQIANNSDGDVFISFHRNFAERTNLYNGIQTLVYGDNPVALRLAEDINAQLEAVGFQNLGIEERKELVVLRRTRMPAVLLEVGFINSTEDNELFDEKFDEIVEAIADGIMEALPMETRNTAINETGENTDVESGGTPNVGSSMLTDRVPANSMSTNGTRNNGIQNNGMQMDGIRNDRRSDERRLDNDIVEDGRTSRMASPMSQDEPMRQGMTPSVSQNNQMNTGINQSRNQQNPNASQTTPPMSRNRWDDVDESIWIGPIRPENNRPIDVNYYVQVGLFRYPENAVYLMEQLKQQGYETIWKRVGGLIAVWVGPQDTLDQSVAVQQQLQQAGYDTLIVTEVPQRR